MVNHVKLTLEQSEYTALLELANGELRSPGDQARYILRKEMRKLGLLSDEVESEPESNRSVVVEGRQHDNA